MKSCENSIQRPIRKKIKDIISFEKNMSPQIRKITIPENGSEYRFVITCTCNRSEFHLKDFPKEKRGLICKRENTLSSSLEERR